VELHCVIGLFGLLHRGTKVTHYSENHGRDDSPSLLPCHAEWIGIVDVRAQSPLTVSGALCGLDGEKVEAPSMPHTISGVGSERPL
jgi:hypothetical protein